MAKEKGPLASCLRKTIHHCSQSMLDGIFELAILDQADPRPDLEYRFQLVRDNLDNALAQLAKVKQVAQDAGCQAVLDALEEHIEFGHDFK